MNKCKQLHLSQGWIDFDLGPGFVELDSVWSQKGQFWVQRGLQFVQDYSQFRLTINES